MTRLSKEALDRLEEALPTERAAKVSDPDAPGASVVALDSDSDDWLGQFTLEGGHPASVPEASPSPESSPSMGALEDFQSEIQTGFVPEPEPEPTPVSGHARVRSGTDAGVALQRMAPGTESRFSADVATPGVIFFLVLACLLGTTAFPVLHRGRTNARSSAGLPQAATGTVPEHLLKSPSVVAPAIELSASPSVAANRVSAAVPDGPEPLRASPENEERRLSTPQPPAFVLTSGVRPSAQTPADEGTALAGTPAPAAAASLPVAVATASVPAGGAATSITPPPLPAPVPVVPAVVSLPRPAPDLTAIGVPASPDARPSTPVPIPAAPPGPANRTEPEPAGRSVPPAPSGGEMRAIQAVLSRYQTAFNDLNASIAKSVWPSVDEQKLGKAFDQLERQDMAFDACQISVSDGAALASCEGHTRYVRKVGSRTERIEPRTWRFRLENTTQGWMIAGVETR